MATAQTQPSSVSHSHIPGFFYNPQDPFHSIFPIRNIETSPLLDKAGDAVSTTGNLTQSNLKISSHAMTADGNCEMCQFIQYIPGPTGKAGVAYKSAQTLDLSGAHRIVFFAKGELGGENVAFVAIGKPSNTSPVLPNIFANLKFAVTGKEITLTNGWTRYQLSLNGSDLTGVTDPFGFIVSKVRSQAPSSSNSPQPPLTDANANHIAIFLKGVTFDSNPAVKPIPTVQLSSINTTSTTTTVKGALQ
ncbi:MAG: hypothetical protein M3044_02935 [Thermoproteota archaeon]|nr:hypothetical protein [Thermoproteota archaeon]